MQRLLVHWRGHQGSNAANKAALHALVATRQAPGLLAYVSGAVAGWCTIAPRAEFKRLKRSRKLAALDDQPVWSIPCFFVGKDFRRQSLTRALIEGAVAYARAHGARLTPDGGRALVP